jgi:hypothetical protein
MCFCTNVSATSSSRVIIFGWPDAWLSFGVLYDESFEFDPGGLALRPSLFAGFQLACLPRFRQLCFHIFADSFVVRVLVSVQCRHDDWVHGSHHYFGWHTAGRTHCVTWRQLIMTAALLFPSRTTDSRRMVEDQSRRGHCGLWGTTKAHNFRCQCRWSAHEQTCCNIYV